MKKPSVCILKTDGTNCDLETTYAFEKAGGNTQVISLNQLKKNKKILDDFQILAIPGGFSYGDDIASGKIFALELISFLKESIYEFVDKKKLIIGICNGFQVLVRMGLLPSKNHNKPEATLINNDSGKFECRWVNMIIEKSPCIFTQGLEGKEITLQVAHGEGKFYCSNEQLTNIEKNNLIVLRYSYNGKATNKYPENPNGALNAIAGICDTSGHIFGLMPHPERFVENYHYPNWRHEKISPQGLLIFERAIQYFL